jgi:hypothetical protein
MTCDDQNGTQVFELLEGSVRVWIEQGAIHMIAVELPSQDPVELTGDMARQLAATLQEMVDRLD